MNFPKRGLYQHLRAPNDENGNPQRLWFVYTPNGRVAICIDEGYCGRPRQLREPFFYELPEFDVSVDEYNFFKEKYNTKEL